MAAGAATNADLAIAEEVVGPHYVVEARGLKVNVLNAGVIGGEQGNPVMHLVERH